MRAVQRSTNSDRSQPVALCKSPSKRQRTIVEGHHHGSEPHITQYQSQTFELPPLAQLLSSVDQEDDNDDNLFLPLDARMALHGPSSSDAEFSATGPASDIQGHQVAGVTQDAISASLPVICLPDNAVQPPTQLNSCTGSRLGVNASLAAQHHLRDDQQRGLQQPILGLSAPGAWSDHGEGLQPQSVSTQHMHAADPLDVQHHLSNEPLSPHTLASMFDMPALSFDSGQRLHDDDAMASTPQSQPQQAADFQIHGNDQAHIHGGFDSSSFNDLQHAHQLPWTSSSMGDLQWADACSAPMNLPNVIRKTSSDSTIDPSTGKLLVYGKAMAYLNEPELPAVTALFSDMSSRTSQKSWDSSSMPHARAGSQAAKAAKRKRSSIRTASLTPPPQSYALQGSVQRYNHQPEITTQPYQSDQQAALSANPVQSHTMAAPIAPHPGLGTAAVLDPNEHGHELLAEGILVQPMPPYPPLPGPSTPPQSHLHPARGMQQPQEAHAAQLQPPTAMAQHWPNTIHYGQAESVRAGCTGTGRIGVSSAEAHMQMPGMGATVSSAPVLGGTPASMPARKAFGGILSGVVKEAAETATKRPPVFRYEDFKTANAADSFRGVSRDRWSVQWNASIPKADKDAGEHFLGRFSQQTTAARACDVANLKVHGANAVTNFPAREYEDGMEELAPISVLDVVMALQRQGAIGQYKNSRYQGVWQLDRSCWEARLEETRTQESSTADKASPDGDQSQSQLVPP